jgi:LL-diaminopimelate aminotransferase
MTRLEKLPPYLFSSIDEARRAAVAAGKDVINLGIGDPDRPTPQPLLARMAEAVQDPANHCYPSNQGSGQLRKAIAAWLKRYYQVDVDPETQVLVLIGSKEGLAHLPLALVEEGDRGLVPDIGYPVYANAATLAGAVAETYALTAENAFVPEIDALAEAADERTRLIMLNYPHNPTGADVPPGYFRTLAERFRGRNTVLVNDAAYMAVSFGDQAPPSLLAETDPLQDRVIEFHSLSKIFNMTGWRIGFAIGHPEIIAALDKVKQNMDSGVFGAIQDVAVHALGADYESLLASVMQVYPPRRRIVLDALQAADIEVFPAASTFYVWARVPEGRTSMEFCRQLLDEQAVVVTPGNGFGPGGEGWFRISLTAPDDRLAEACARMRRI